MAAKASPPAASGGVRCPNCDKRLAEELRGWARFWCRGCKAYVEIAR